MAKYASFLLKKYVNEIYLLYCKPRANNQIYVVRWADGYSDPCVLNCGVRQGRQTSPRLFNLYVDQLIGRLSSMHAGCRIDVSVNNITYADDMVRLSPSMVGIRKML